ncbi:MAG: SAM-dependent methyltransferase [Thermodesulfobacteriota bacterium]
MAEDSKTYEMRPIGFLHTDAETVPRHYSISDVEGKIVVDRVYQDGLRDIKAGDRIAVLFVFDRSPAFVPAIHLIQRPPVTGRLTGVFSICSPVRPNPIGLSVLTVTAKDENILSVKGIDMLDGTPILDIKPHRHQAAKNGHA